MHRPYPAGTAKALLVSLSTAALFAARLAAAVPIDEGLLTTGYTQEFNSLPASGFTWSNHSTLPGWHASNAAGGFNASAVSSDGASNLADQTIASLGAAGSTDRALAYHTRLNTTPTYLGLGFANNTGEAISAFEVFYRAEQWRESSEQRTLSFTVEYRVGGTAADLNGSSGWTPVANVTFSSLNGAAGAFAELGSEVIEVEIPDASTFWIRWVTSNSATSSTASNDIIAIDDVAVNFPAGLPDLPPVFTVQPAPQTVAVGETATFSATAIGRPAPTYQWYHDGALIPLATSSTLVLTDVQLDQAGNYTVVALNATDDTPSEPALLTVSNDPVPPSIVTQPKSVTVPPGGNAFLSVVASGSPPLDYQWRKNGADILNATSSTYAIIGATEDHNGTYTVRVDNAVNHVISDGAVVTVAVAPDFGLVGWASAGDGTTGGEGGATVRVSNYASFASAVFQDVPLIIEIEGSITGIGDAIRVKSNKTILGIGATARLENLGLNIGWNSSFGEIGNVIIRNITFGSVRAPTDKVSIAYGAKNVWVDHCVFISDLAASGTNKDFYDGQLDITRGAELVTVSWCRFVDHYKNSLVGHGEGNASQDTGKLTVTYHHNAFINVNSRNPSVRFGRVHVFNNYFLNIGDYAIASRQNAEVVIENNWFENVTKPIGADTSLSSVPGFVRGVETNVFLNCGANNITTAPATWIPPYPYSLDPVAEVPDLVMLWSGVGVIGNEAPPAPTTFADWINSSGVPEDERGPADDPDFDGVSNYLEYILARDPAIAEYPPLVITAGHLTGDGYPTVSYRRRSDFPGKNDLLQFASGLDFLTDLGSVELSSIPHDAESENVVTRSAQPLSTHPKQFLRIRAELP